MVCGMAGPMEGINVVELGVWVAGPATGGILADWGADVIKIEPPTGDPARMFGRMLGLDVDVSPPFEMDNRSKRSVVIDLTTEDGRGTALELISGADVFITNVRPGALRRLGLDYESLAPEHPRLVYGLITGYGETGPDADRAAYDVAAFWARGGLAHLLTRPGETPPFQRGGMGDHSAGMTLAAAVCAALVSRNRTGTGQLVSTSLYRQGAYTVSFDLNTYLMSGQPIAIGQREKMFNPCMNNYATGDGRRFWIVGLEVDRHWPPLCRAVGKVEWLDDPRFADARSRAVNAVELNPQFLQYLPPERILRQLIRFNMPACEVPHVWIPPPRRRPVTQQQPICLTQNHGHDVMVCHAASMTVGSDTYRLASDRAQSPAAMTGDSRPVQSRVPQAIA